MTIHNNKNLARLGVCSVVLIAIAIATSATSSDPEQSSSPRGSYGGAYVSVDAQGYSSSSEGVSSLAVVSSVPSVEVSDEPSLVVAINSGSALAAILDGVRYEADQYARGGSAYNTPDTISGASQDALFQSERYGTYSYQIPVYEGSYTIHLHLAEIYHESAGLRSFNLSVEGNIELSQLDLYSQVGHDGAFSYIVEDVRVTDGTLDISLEGLTDAGTMAGFAVYSADGGIASSRTVANCSGYVGLTFDDGPSRDTRDLISALKRNNLMPVTFFVNGANISDPTVIQEMLTVGQVQSHAYDHADLTAMNRIKVMHQLSRNNDAIMKAGAPKPTIIRPPFGSYNATVTSVANQLGLQLIRWDIDSEDWNSVSAASIVNSVSQLQDGQNILLHENQGNTINPKTVAQMAAALKARGLCPGVIDPNTGRVVAP